MMCDRTYAICSLFLLNNYDAFNKMNYVQSNLLTAKHRKLNVKCLHKTWMDACFELITAFGLLCSFLTS